MVSDFPPAFLPVADFSLNLNGGIYAASRSLHLDPVPEVAELREIGVLGPHVRRRARDEASAAVGAGDRDALGDARGGCVDADAFRGAKPILVA